MKPVPFGTDAHLIRKHELGGMMNADEARMNKELLQEIARRKGSSPETNKTPLKLRASHE